MTTMDEKTPLKSRVRIFTVEDVAKHNTSSSCWVSRNGKVYNVTGFLNDHPGGDDLILEWAGKDITDAMADPVEHTHSDSAYDMLESYVIGRLGAEANIVDKDWEATDDFHPDDTDLSADFEKCGFLDLRKPLLRQVWESNFSKSFYLQQVHQPRHLAYSARLFGPGFLEIFTLTTWYTVPILWLPISAFLFYRSICQFSGIYAPLFANPFELPLDDITTGSLLKTLSCFFAGNVIWTILEYTLHRFLFHIDEWLPDSPVFLTLHFLLHGIHHYLPMDKLRLVMPPALFFMLSFPFTRLAYVLFGIPAANGVISGAFAFYVLYDCMHYALHHTKLPQYMREMKKYHLAHHYKNFELGFGVTSKIWDYVFNTVLPV
ncbi:fatty acid alpha-hydroxylase [Tulasnella sp. 419]|nr:fatty acid alpha-hydroxylase [Tulasnella sp. 418]KAG8963298.1 fatty acid alpha-hydroxylase [Tulasnella sp. 419]